MFSKCFSSWHLVNNITYVIHANVKELSLSCIWDWFSIKLPVPSNRQYSPQIHHWSDFEIATISKWFPFQISVVMGHHKFLPGWTDIRFCVCVCECVCVRACTWEREKVKISYACWAEKVILRHVKHRYKLQYIFNHILIMCYLMTLPCAKNTQNWHHLVQESGALVE